MKFIDRTRELMRLTDSLSNAKNKLIVVYGRRRLGKSTLIKKVLKEGDIYYEASKSESSIQRSALASTIAFEYKDFDKPTFPNWDSLLSSFNSQCKEESTLMLDDFPYLVEHDKSLPSIIQRIIDSGDMRYNLLLCGSSHRIM